MAEEGLERDKGPFFHIITRFQIDCYSTHVAIQLPGFDASKSLKAAEGAYIGHNPRKVKGGPAPLKLSLEWCKEQGYRLVCWDGL